MKTFWKIVLLLIFIITLAFVGYNLTYANGYIPNGIQTFDYIDSSGNNWFCVTDNEEFKDCFSCCNNNCEVSIITATQTNEPTNILDIPIPTKTIKPEKNKCNAGGGNGPEYYWDEILQDWIECDPGNSGNNNNGKD